MKPWWRRLAAYGRPHGGGLAAVMTLTLVGVALDVSKPWPLKLILDGVIGDELLPRGAGWLHALPGAATRDGLLAWLAGGTVAVFVASQLVRIALAGVQARVGNRMTYDLATDLFDRLQRMSLRFHNRRPTGDLVRRVTANCGCVREFFLWVCVPALSSLVSLVVLFVVMWKLDWLLAVVAILAAFPLGLLIRKFAKPMSEQTYRQQELEGEMMALAEQTLTALPVVQAFGREAHEERRFRRLSGRTLQATLRATAAQMRFQVSTGAVTAVATAALLFVGGLHLLFASLSVGSLLVFLAYLAALYAPLETLAYLTHGWASAAAGARRVFELLDTEDAVRDAPNAKPLLAKAPGAVRMENVTFGYEPGRPVLNGVNFEAKPGETVALVGPTGAGKSTLVALIPRLFDPWEGRVMLDGMDARELKIGDLRSQIAILLQEPFLLPLTVAENIAYGRPGASRAEIEAAALAASADEFIRRLPRGYDTVIGEQGATLSGGEKQRLAIARAFLKNAPVLILDEPTSALDTLTETQVMEALERLRQGRTTILIAHRPSTIQRADRVVRLAAGRIVP